MPEFLKKLIATPSAVEVRAPKGKRNVTSTVKLLHGKGFSAVREDIFKIGLARQKAKKVA